MPVQAFHLAKERGAKPGVRDHNRKPLALDYRHELSFDALGSIGLWACWGIELMFSDFKNRGFELEDSQLSQADRLERLVLVIVLAMHWRVCVGRTDVANRPTLHDDLEHWGFKKPYRSPVSLFKRD